MKIYYQEQPPKQKSGKKGKLSKAEKEKLKKEEAERKAKEEEEAQLRAEEEERERQERERQEKEERARIEAEERKRHAAEVGELNSILEGNLTALENQNAERRAKAKWNRYMLCDGSPDPTIPGEINTYMNLWKEDDSKNDIESVLKESQLTHSLIGELSFLLDDTPEEELSEKDAANYKQTILELETLLAEKLDIATVDLLKDAASMADQETSNLQLVQQNERILLMLWGNLSKNPRFKTFEFEEQNFGFELTKQLASLDIAIRIMHLKYDHLSHHCRTFHSKKKKKVVPPPPEPEPEPEEKAEEEKKEGEGEDAEGEETIPGMEDLTLKLESEQAENNEEEKKEGEEEGEEKKEGEEETKKEEEAEQAPVEEEEEEEEIEEDEDVVDLRQYQPLGGVIYFDLLHLPPQPKNAKGWLMTQDVCDELKRMPYPGNDNKLGQTLSGTLPMGQTLDPKAIASAAAAAEALGAPPVGLNFTLPENVLFSEEPQMAYWSPEGKHWRLDGFADMKYDEDGRTVSVKTINFGALTCTQDKHINMPFQSWELRPKQANNALLTIIAALVEIEIEIKEGLCCFRQPEDSETKPELENIKDKWVTPKELIQLLYSAGVNVFPTTESKKYVSISEKEDLTEEGVYQQMALTASHFAFSWSKWNAESGTEKIVVQGTELLQDEPVIERRKQKRKEKDEWSLLMISSQRAMKLRMTEFDDQFTEDFAEGTEFHADLYHMVLDLSTEQGIDRMKLSSFQFVDAVYQLLSATRVITYS
ncbi:dynein axonemal intermediate chain 7-like isoform X2 [Ptychodera flava]|uniref:dynein axonemal intermediate chain 7-like isoform X2 n=1 Tax=Ptychodera flava TaxID=63121 RepID=UPI00396A4990